VRNQIVPSLQFLFEIGFGSLDPGFPSGKAVEMEDPLKEEGKPKQRRTGKGDSRPVPTEELPEGREKLLLIHGSVQLTANNGAQRQRKQRQTVDSQNEAGSAAFSVCTAARAGFAEAHHIGTAVATTFQSRAHGAIRSAAEYFIEMPC